MFVVILDFLESANLGFSFSSVILVFLVLFVISSFLMDSRFLHIWGL